MKKFHPTLSDSHISRRQEDWLQGTGLKRLQSLVREDCIPDQRVYLRICSLQAQMKTLRMICNKITQGLLTDGCQVPESKWQRSLLPGMNDEVNIRSLYEDSSNDVIKSFKQMRSRISRRIS